MPQVSIQELVEQEFTLKGKSFRHILAQVYLEAGVSHEAMKNALAGTAVSKDTALSLAIWAANQFGADLDVKSMVMAPTKAEKRAQDLKGTAPSE